MNIRTIELSFISDQNNDRPSVEGHTGTLDHFNKSVPIDRGIVSSGGDG